MKEWTSTDRRTYVEWIESVSEAEAGSAAPVITIEGYFLTALMMHSDDAYLAHITS